MLTHAAEHFQGCTYRGETGWNALEALQKRGRKRDRPWLEYFGGAELLRFLGRVTERESGSSDEKCVPWLEVWTDYDEWNGYNTVGDPVLHVDLAKRSAVLVVAPLCAHPALGPRDVASRNAAPCADSRGPLGANNRRLCDAGENALQE